VIDLSALSDFSSQTNDVHAPGSLTVTDQGTVLDPELTSLNNVTVTLDGTGTLSIDPWATLTNGTITITAASYMFHGLNDIDSSNLYVQANADLTLPAVASYTSRNNFATTTFQATGSGSVLSLPALTSTGVNATYPGQIQVQALSGGDVKLPLLTQLNGSSVTVGNGGTMELGTAVVSTPALGVSATISVPQLPQGVPINLAGAYNSDTFNVAQGATLDLTGGQNVTYTGSFKSSGAGTITLDGGTLSIGIGGATFDFPDGMFQWSGGVIDGGLGVLTNTGTINLVGSNLKELAFDATLDNFGTIVQTGSGNLYLHSDNAAPTVLKNERGASYLLEADSGVSDDARGNEIDNVGIIRKTGGTRTSPLDVGGQLINTGTIQADSGTISLAATIAQISQGALTAGNWNAESGATLDFPSGTSITTNEGNVTLDGASATIAGISGLATNNGSFSVTGGASFSTAGDFSNTGSLTIGAGSTLTVNGSYSQGSAGSLTVGIGGATSGNEYGQLNVTGSATLAGAVNASTASGFTPSAGDSFPIVTYASETGGSSLSFTGVNSGALSIFQPVVGPINIVLSTVRARPTSSSSRSPSRPTPRRARTSR